MSSAPPPRDYSLAAEGVADHIRNALQLLSNNEDEDWAHLIVLMSAARSRLRQALALLEQRPAP